MRLIHSMESTEHFPCPDNSYHYSKSLNECFYVSKVAMSFWEANNECLHRGGFIATVLTKASKQTEFVRYRIKQMNISPPGTLWLGTGVLSEGKSAKSEMAHGQPVVTLTISCDSFGKGSKWKVKEADPKARFPFICKSIRKQTRNLTRIEPLEFENSLEIVPYSNKELVINGVYD